MTIAYILHTLWEIAKFGFALVVMFILGSIFLCVCIAWCHPGAKWRKRHGKNRGPE